MGTPRPHAVFQVLVSAGLFGLGGVALGACAAASVPSVGGRPWPENAVDRELRRLSEQAVGETHAPPGPARRAREQALLARLERLPHEETRGYRLDRALLEAHLGRRVAVLDETPHSSLPVLVPSPGLSPATAAEAKELTTALEKLGVVEARALAPAETATTAWSAVFLALADRVRPTLPLSPARASFETPEFRRQWARLGPRLSADLGLGSDTAPARTTVGGLEAAYEALRRQQGPRFRPWDTGRLLLGLGSDDRALVFAALEAMNVLPKAGDVEAEERSGQGPRR